VDLEFEVEVVAVRAATEKECEHGHGTSKESGDCGKPDCGCKA
jgi:FKBP-type peptidyl-prolyl cis-trans isomerase 2